MRAAESSDCFPIPPLTDSLITAIGSKLYAQDLRRTIALSGKAAPGTNNALQFAPVDAHSNASINNLGQISFNAKWTSRTDPQLGGRGSWLLDGNLTPVSVVRDGDIVTTPAGTFAIRRVSATFMNSSGQILIGGIVAKDDLETDTTTLFFRRQGMPIEVVVQNGDTLPGMEETPINIFLWYYASLNDSGDVAGPMGDMQQIGAWSWNVSDGLKLVVQSGDVAPGIPGNVEFSGMNPPLINNSENLAIDGSLRHGSDITSANSGGIWLYDRTGKGSLVVRAGDSAAGTLPGVQFAYLDAIRLTDRNDVLFYGEVRSDVSLISKSNDSGIWSAGPDGVVKIARAGDHAWGMPDNVVLGSLEYLTLRNPFAHNRNGDTAFVSGLTSFGENGTVPLGEALWQARFGETPRLVARAGDQPLGTAAGSEFVSFNEASLNDRGFIAVFATVREPSGTRPNEQTGEPEQLWRSYEGIWAQDRFGVLQPIILEGDSIDVDDGPLIDLRTIASLDSNTLADTWFSTMNDRGQLVFQAEFNDGATGVFLSNAVISLAGDYDNDGEVDQADYQIWKSAFGILDLAADGNGDGFVNAADYTIWRDNLGESLSGGAAFRRVLPEPAEVHSVCAIAAAIGCVVRRRRGWGGRAMQP